MTLNSINFNFIEMRGAVNLRSEFLLWFFFLSASLKAFSAKSAQNELMFAFTIVLLIVFFIIAALVYAYKKYRNTGEVESVDQESEDSFSTFGYVMKNSFVILVMMAIICIIIATVNMDA